MVKMIKTKATISWLNITPITQKAKKFANIAMKKLSTFPYLMHLIPSSIISTLSIATHGVNRSVSTIAKTVYATVLTKLKFSKETATKTNPAVTAKLKLHPKGGMIKAKKPTTMHISNCLKFLLIIDLIAPITSNRSAIGIKAIKKMF